MKVNKMGKTENEVQQKIGEYKADIQSLKDSNQEIKNDIKAILAQLKENNETAEKKYVTQTEFAPYKKVCWLVGGLILTAIVNEALGTIKSYNSVKNQLIRQKAKEAIDK